MSTTKLTRPEHHVILPEIAKKYGRTVSTIGTTWVPDPAWPDATGRRGRWLEYDPDEVDAAVSQIASRPPLPEGPPDELLTTEQAAGYAGIQAVTIRGDIRRGRWPEPDDTSDGVKRWKRSTVAAVMNSRRSYRKSARPARGGQ